VIWGWTNEGLNFDIASRQRRRGNLMGIDQIDLEIASSA